MFTGHIAGFGTGSGVRFVVGTWAQSPFGAFTDVMVAGECRTAKPRGGRAAEDSADASAPAW